MPTYYSPTGNPEIWAQMPSGYMTESEWFAANPKETATIDTGSDDGGPASIDIETRITVIEDIVLSLLRGD